MSALQYRILQYIKTGNLSRLKTETETSDALKCVIDDCKLEKVGYGCLSLGNWAILKNYVYYYMEDTHSKYSAINWPGHNISYLI